MDYSLCIGFRVFLIKKMMVCDLKQATDVTSDNCVINFSLAITRVFMWSIMHRKTRTFSFAKTGNRYYNERLYVIDQYILVPRIVVKTCLE